MDTKEKLFSEEELEQKINLKLNEITDFCKIKKGTSMILCFSLKVFISRRKISMYGLKKSIKS
jgi:hypothetical protein